MKLLKSKRFLMVVMVAVVLVFTAGCGGGGKTEDSTGSKGGTAFHNAAGDPNVLTVVVSADPNTMDPAMNAWFPPHQVSRHIYEPLFAMDKDLKLQGLLVDKWEYKDDNTIQMHLREGIHA